MAAGELLPGTLLGGLDGKIRALLWPMLSSDTASVVDPSDLVLVAGQLGYLNADRLLRVVGP